MKNRKTVFILLGCLTVGVAVLATFTWGAQKAATAREGTKDKAGPTKKAAFPLPSATSVPTSPDEKRDVRVAGRDPFRALVVRQSDEPLFPLVPGKQGLLVKQLQLKGIVKSKGHFLAVMETRQSPGTLLFRENDDVADGRVMSITEDTVVFQERAVDPLGKPYVRDVVKKISDSGGIIP
jgi:Tfp pilus assembly protein PilP